MLRGDVHRLKVPAGTGREQHGERFGVILQSDALLPRSVVVVAPTSTSVLAASFRPTIEVEGQSTRVLVEQLSAVDVSRLGRRVGRLDVEERWAVDDAIGMVLGLA